MSQNCVKSSLIITNKKFQISQSFVVTSLNYTVTNYINDIHCLKYTKCKNTFFKNGLDYHNYFISCNCFVYVQLKMLFQKYYIIQIFIVKYFYKYFLLLY